jgi:NAD(P)H-dependent FMN reductase
MKITIISGSHREQGQSHKVARFIEKTLLSQQLCNSTWLFSLAGNPLPLWDEAIWNGDTDWQARLSPISRNLSESDAFVVIAPEYHGQVPAGLKNFFLMWSKGELAHKPALIVGVSSSTGGAYPVAELRMSSYKNNRICYIPEHLIIRNVEKVLNDNPDDNDKEADRYFRERTLFALKILREYAEALIPVRKSGLTFHPDFKNGM